MTTFPSVTGGQLIRAVRKLGFEVLRIKGSHHFLQHFKIPEKVFFVNHFSRNSTGKILIQELKKRFLECLMGHLSKGMSFMSYCTKNKLITKILSN